ncbi:fumarylacetoacetase [Nocardioides sp. Soil805]|uniref:fumarylacetoacetase n=1 Tax=Nocardioides sp. Soil805 TaxID=1736416 RepID=UPI0007025655|nr:fumarylacetoacetase [Nocardioides sp. Soil805]KRF37093.1 fumarylacetoacetase [Nocardioides sp. Soil805]
MTEMPTTWVAGAAGSLFDLDNLPYGVFSLTDDSPRVGVRIGDHVLDLAPVAEIAVTDGQSPASVLAAAWRTPSLNAFMAMGPEQWAIAREWITEVLGHDVHEARTAPHVHPLADVTLHLPIEVGDYVDFYASEHHASNVGRIFRPDQEPLLPNWKHLPVGYHGRAGTVVPSGTDIVRPCGQRKAPTEDAPTYGPSRRLDIEAELGFVIGTPSRLGERVSTADFAAHTFGVVGLNDWSARDVQAWEYVPLGPFLGKSFATSISHWVTPLAALDAAWTELPGQDPEPLDYLRVDGPAGLDIAVEVVLDGEVVSRPPYSSMYWSPAQMLAHTTVNGATVRTGDLWGSGTVSGPDVDQRGSLLELSWGGKEPFTVAGRERTFLEDGDVVTLRYTAPGTAGGRIALGEVTGRVVPAR